METIYHGRTMMAEGTSFMVMDMLDGRKKQIYRMTGHQVTNGILQIRINNRQRRSMKGVSKNVKN